MRFEIARASYSIADTCPIEGALKDGGRWFVEVASLEDLLALRDRCGSDLIVTKGALSEHHKLWIYDDYME